MNFDTVRDWLAAHATDLSEQEVHELQTLLPQSSTGGNGPGPRTQSSTGGNGPGPNGG